MAIRGKNSDSNNAYRKQAEALWNIFSSVPRPSDDLEKRIISGSTAAGSMKGVHLTSNSWIYRAAAALLFLIGAGLFYYYLIDNDVTSVTELSHEVKIYSTDLDQIIDVHLTDHIYIQLNSQSELQILTYDDKLNPRLVFLVGEAYFNIDKAPGGFEIFTEAGVVEVVGTAFNVRVKDEEVEVAVASGIVTLRGLPNEETDSVVQIPAGHKSLKKKNAPAIEPLPVDVELYLFWRKGRFVFEQTPLHDVLRNLERAYNVRIDLHTKDLGEIRVTGEFGREPLQQILNEICWSANLRFRQVDETYILYQPD
jgi:transmembrane sensor